MKFQIINFYHDQRNARIKLQDNKLGIKRLGPWYITNGSRFLHSDLTVQDLCVHPKTGLYSGWFASREKARQALRSYKAKVAAGN